MLIRGAIVWLVAWSMLALFGWASRMDQEAYSMASAMCSSLGANPYRPSPGVYFCERSDGSLWAVPKP